MKKLISIIKIMNKNSLWIKKLLNIPNHIGNHDNQVGKLFVKSEIFHNCGPSEENSKHHDIFQAICCIVTEFLIMQSEEVNKGIKSGKRDLAYFKIVPLVCEIELRGRYNLLHFPTDINSLDIENSKIAYICS